MAGGARHRSPVTAPSRFPHGETLYVPEAGLCKTRRRVLVRHDYRQQARRSSVTDCRTQTPCAVAATVSQTRAQTSRTRERFFRFPDHPAGSGSATRNQE
ncbi:hypothetical protein GCM10012287_22760 [Streptomyces daqingensis]|uniref:Uncharacterized protein n=1 Tax=Streptomyces daqingensis TaxID=1472640 RepID=A0ABQ2M7R5_9ACTN|nr:hypothetical protein GCM10012287_22760 [Streptomyces daqingensis]